MLTLFNIETNHPIIIFLSFLIIVIPMIVKYIKKGKIIYEEDKFDEKDFIEEVNNINNYITNNYINQSKINITDDFEKHKYDQINEYFANEQKQHKHINNNIESSIMQYRFPTTVRERYNHKTKVLPEPKNIIGKKKYSNYRYTTLFVDNIHEVSCIMRGSFNPDGSINLESGNWKERNGKYEWARKIIFKTRFGNKLGMLNIQGSPARIFQACEFITRNIQSINTKEWGSISVRSEDKFHILFPDEYGNMCRVPGSFIYWVN